MNRNGSACNKTWYLFAFSPSEKLVSVPVRVLYIFFNWRGVKKSCVYELESHFLPLHPQYYQGNINCLMASGCHLSPWHLSKHCVPGEVTSPVFPGSTSAVTCHFVSLVSALTESATLAASPRLNAACRHRHSESLWFHVSWKHHTRFCHWGTAPGLNYYAVALGSRSLVQKD